MLYTGVYTGSLRYIHIVYVAYSRVLERPAAAGLRRGYRRQRQRPRLGRPSRALTRVFVAVPGVGQVFTTLRSKSLTRSNCWLSSSQFAPSRLLRRRPARWWAGWKRRIRPRTTQRRQHPVAGSPAAQRTAARADTQHHQAPTTGSPAPAHPGSPTGSASRPFEPASSNCTAQSP